MDFALSEEQRMFRDMFRNFAAKEVAPGPTR
jgi:alkylation response protein AidB-like acyl-CoA dehydrogenase